MTSKTIDWLECYRCGDKIAPSEGELAMLPEYQYRQLPFHKCCVDSLIVISAHEHKQGE